MAFAQGHPTLSQRHFMKSMTLQIAIALPVVLDLVR